MSSRKVKSASASASASNKVASKPDIIPEKCIEDIYKKKTLHEHILSTPDTYIGSGECDNKEMYILNEETGKLVSSNISFPPGLYKINDEINVNAKDHSVRDNTCTEIRFTINQKDNIISVYNNGQGIPVEIHKEFGVYVPQMIFGELLTSSNYETKGKIVGGKNGYGAKLANIYYLEFIVETLDKKAKKKYYQKFENNMYKINEPIITNATAKEQSYTKITFKPDLKRFGLDNLTDDIVSLLKKRVYDIAACTHKGVSVYLNDKNININTFEDYIKLYYDKLPSDLVYQEFNPRWKVGVLFDNHSGFTQVSFVNGVCTYQGGTHVQHVLDQITKELIAHIKEKHKNTTVKSSYIKDNITLFIDCTIEDPSFKSQTKEELTTKISEFGSRCEMNADFIKKIIKTGIVDEIVRLADFKNMGELTKTDFKKTNNIKSIEKLDDAHLAGTRRAKECNLFLTEGDSAKAFAMSGLDKLGRDRNGAFPLRGKLLNVREASVDQLLKNEEFKNLKQIVGLKQGKKYANLDGLRYGSITILTDQDVDGSHIKGLIINMFATFWPSLLQIKGFIRTMSTPIIKAYKKADAKKLHSINFYNIPTYKKWTEEELKGDTSNYIIKYYKGLGTSTEKEAKELFDDYDKRVISFSWNDVIIDDIVVQVGANQNIENSDSEEKLNNPDNILTKAYLESEEYEALTLAFAGERANDRKKWLIEHDKNDTIDLENKFLTYKDFVHKELKHFSAYSNERSLPNIMDGLKPSNRKVLYVCIKRKLDKEIKVAQLGASVAELTLYHHGEASLFSCIINMAQLFVGSNNINLLLPNGNFGSRRLGGKDSASPRYIFTQLNKLTSLMFRKEDENIYTYVDEDGTLVEPEFYAPIIPFILVNGSEGIGTGFSTYIPPYNPLDIIKNIKLLLKGEEQEDIVPWFRGFKGKVQFLKDNRIQTSGIYEILDNATIKITELPIGLWTENYKKYLDDCMVDSKSLIKTKFIETCMNNSGNNRIDFTITFSGNHMQQMIKSNTLEKHLKLVNTLSLNNMYMYNTKNIITKYDNPNEIIDEYYKMRYTMYRLRKEYFIKVLLNELTILKEKIRFIEYILSKKIIIEKREEDDIIKDLHRLEFKELSYDINSENPSFRYLTDMKLFSLTNNKMKELIAECAKKQNEYDIYMNRTIEEIWTSELDLLEAEYHKWIKTVDEEDTSNNTKSKPKPRQKKGKIIVNEE